MLMVSCLKVMTPARTFACLEFIQFRTSPSNLKLDIKPNTRSTLDKPPRPFQEKLAPSIPTASGSLSSTMWLKQLRGSGKSWALMRPGMMVILILTDLGLD